MLDTTCDCVMQPISQILDMTSEAVLKTARSNQLTHVSLPTGLSHDRNRKASQTQSDPGDAVTSRGPARTLGGSDMSNRNRPANAFGKTTRGVRPKQNRGISDETRIGQQIQPRSNGCWEWTGKNNQRPHPDVNGKTAIAYRFVYETLVGPIPPKHVLHHTCENPICCNPAHLVPMLNGDHVAHHAALRRAS